MAFQDSKYQDADYHQGEVYQDAEFDDDRSYVIFDLTDDNEIIFNINKFESSRQGLNTTQRMMNKKSNTDKVIPLSFSSDSVIDSLSASILEPPPIVSPKLLSDCDTNVCLDLISVPNAFATEELFTDESFNINLNQTPTPIVQILPKNNIIHSDTKYTNESNNQILDGSISSGVSRVSHIDNKSSNIVQVFGISELIISNLKSNNENKFMNKSSENNINMSTNVKSFLNNILFFGIGCISFFLIRKQIKRISLF